MMKPLALAGVVVASVAASSCVDIVALDTERYVEREEKRFTVSGRPELNLSTFDGAIEVRPWDRPEVLVVVEKLGADRAAASTIRVEAEQTGNRIRVSAETPARDAFTFNMRRSARLIVSVPASADLQASSRDGSIDVERVSGRLELRSGDGAIQGRALTGEVRAQTGDGSIDLDAVDGVLDAATGDGRIVARGTFSAVRVRTGDGSVTVQAQPGSMSAQDWDISTGDGSVTLELPDGFGGELDAHTGDGRVSVHDLPVGGVTGRAARNTVRGRLGQGGRLVRVRTGDGSITLRRY
jgi:hypothetical protein